MNNYDRQARMNVERSILSTLIAYSNSVEVKNIFLNKELKASYFNNPFYEEVFSNIESLMLRNILPTIESLAINRGERYRQTMTADVSDNDTYSNYVIELVEIINYSVTAARLQQDILLLKEFQIIDYWNETADNVLNSYWHNRDIFDVSNNIINGYHDLIKEVTEQNIIEQEESIDSIKERAMKKFLERQSGVDTTIKIGNASVDNHLGGMAESELIIIGGRPGMGKTAFALAISKFNSLRGSKRGLYFSLEMLKEQLMMKYASPEMKIPYRDLKSYKLNNEQFATLLNYYDYIEKSNLEIVFENNLEKIIQISKDYKPDYIIIDYLQLVKTNHRTQSREQEVSHISKELKTLSKTCRCPVIALAQLKRIDGEPDLTDLRESGSLEQDADTVIFPYRPMYKEKNFNWDQGLVKFLIPKCRSSGPATFHGFIDLIDFKFYDESPKTFDEYKQMKSIN